ncbi:MAG: polysaccharide deacetylase family protein [Nannocystaceae bacterium]
MSHNTITVVAVALGAASLACSETEGFGSGPGEGGDEGHGGGGEPDLCEWGELATRREPSTAAPGGLSVDNIPMMISFGFDDNGYVDGMAWALDYLEGKRNRAGEGNACTFDDTQVRASFYITSAYELSDQWARAYDDGHEIGNHSHTHDPQTLPQNPSKEFWLNELSTCNDYLIDSCGVPESRIIGFRTPFLSQCDATFEAVTDMGFTYDCSIEHYRVLGEDMYVWPYTLDGGPDPHSTFPAFVTGQYPGLWEMPVYDIFTDVAGGGTATGFDYNMWANAKMTKSEFVQSLKWSLEHRLATNRVPLLIGAHTDYYSADNADANAASVASYEERRAAVEEFLDYALALHPDIRVVSYAQILRWVRAPVGLDGAR